MRILLANPNATAAITEACLALARAVASPGTEVVPWTNAEGPVVVDSFLGDYAAGRPLLLGLQALRPTPDAVVLAGFGNYGTFAAKEMLAVPVVGMAEAAMALAALLAHRFAILTTHPRMVPYTEDLVRLLGFEAKCAAVRAVALPAATEPQPPAGRVLADLAEAAGRVIEEAGADAIVLGGSCLSPWAADLATRARLPVLEPVACGVRVAEALVGLGLAQSKHRKFAPPPQPLDAYR